MPVVLRHAGFAVRILLPPREHGPPHVHVTKGGGEVIIELPARGDPQRIRGVFAMRNADVVAAFRIVEGHAELLMTHWRRHHGEPRDQHR